MVNLSKTQKNRAVYINLLKRIFVYTIGTFIMCLGLTFIIYVKVGYSPVDMFVISVQNWLKSDNYAFLLTCYNAMIFVLALVTYLIKILMKKKKFSILDVPFYASQLVPLFTTGIIIDMYYVGFIKNFNLSELNYFVKLLIFIASWILFCLGTSLIVWSNMFLSSQSSINIDFTIIFKMKFMTSRIIFDVFFASIGLVICLSTSIDKIWELVNVGTFIIVLITGPMMGIFLNYFQKFKFFKGGEINEN